MNYLFENFPQLLTAGTLGFLLSQLISHFLAKSRNKENFQRSVSYKESEAEKEIISHLGIFANGILNCWEEGTVYAVSSKSGPPNMPVKLNKRIEFLDYSVLKQELVKLGIFPANMWHSLDRLPEEIVRINRTIETKTKKDVFVDCCHFSEKCKTLWGMVAAEYVARGGNIKELTKPMPFPIPQF